MKNLKFAVAFIATAMISGCEGQQDPLENNGQGGTGIGGDGSIQLIADKTEVEADGLDKVTFRVITTNEAGVEEDLSELYPRTVRIVEVESGESLPYKTFTKSSIENRTVEYKAIYKETESANTVTVTFKNRGKYEKYYQNVALVELTGTWCISCPLMVEAIEDMDPAIRKHTVVMAVHTSTKDDYDHLEPVTDKTIAKNMLTAFDGSSIPNCIFDLNEMSHVATKANVENIIYSYLSNHYATCGVKVISSSLEDKSLKIKAAMTSATGGEYDLGWVFVADGFKYSGGTLESGIYNDVVIAASDNFYKISPDRFTVEADKETTKEFSCELPYLPEGFDSSKARVIVFALTRTENDFTSTIVDNITECPLGESNDYILN